MDIHILAIHFRFDMGIVLVDISDNVFFQEESISRKIRDIILVTHFFSVSYYADMSIQHIFQD